MQDKGKFKIKIIDPNQAKNIYQIKQINEVTKLQW
jgi:hypothetical protein